MSENKDDQELFDSWLAANLKTKQAANPAFSQNIIQEIERIKTRKLLRKTIFQECLALASLVLFVLGVAGLVNYIPFSKMIYPMLESGSNTLTHAVSIPPQIYLTAFPLLLLISCLLAKALWDKLSSEL